MSDYKNDFRYRLMSVKNIIEVCFKNEPKGRWPNLDRGRKILTTEDELNQYVVSYGEMHIAKCNEAFKDFPFQSITEDFEIIDWGCGQGLISLRAFEILREKGLTHRFKKVALIDPSKASIFRALFNWVKLRNNTHLDFEINYRIYYLPTIGLSTDDQVKELYGFFSSKPIVLHIFSNILDVPDIDLKRLSEFVKRMKGKHYIMCMGPVEAYPMRMDTFFDYFNFTRLFSDVTNRNYGTIANGYPFTCKTKCFSLERQ